MSDLCFLTATALRELIRSRRASVTEVLQAHLAQIERVNPKVNAIVTLRADEALAEARAADAALARGEEGGPLLGLPVAHKDLVPTRGLRTTWGSPHLQGPRARPRRAHRGAHQGRRRHHGRQDQYARSSARARRRSTRSSARRCNPYDPSKTCGGSSGGAAVALACGARPHRRRQRPGRLAAQPGELLQCRRLPALARTRAHVAERARLGAVLRRGADGAHGGGRGAAALGHRRARSALAHRHRRARRALSRPARPQLRAACGSRGAGTSAACPSTRA